MMKRTPLKRGTKQLRRTPIKRKQKSKEEIQENREEQEKMWNLFLEIWNNSPHFCIETGEYLGEECLTVYMHHFLEKSKYSQFKFEKWNIGIISHRTHDQCHINIDKCPKIKYKTELLKAKYL